MYSLPLAALVALLLLPHLAQSQAPAAPAADWQIVRSHQRIYSVPPSWQTTYARTDSLSLISYRSPDLENVLWVATVRMPDRRGPSPLAPALGRVLRYVGVYGFTPAYTAEQGLDYMEGMGICWRGGQELRYDVRVVNEKGHHLLVFLLLSPAHTVFTESALPVLLHQLTPPALHR
jgi:hypothetical protein